MAFIRAYINITYIRFIHSAHIFHLSVLITDNVTCIYIHSVHSLGSHPPFIDYHKVTYIDVHTFTSMHTYIHLHTFTSMQTYIHLHTFTYIVRHQWRIQGEAKRPWPPPLASDTRMFRDFKRAVGSSQGLISSTDHLTCSGNISLVS